jgi:predicted HAD superfamily Cof-like phosphohydrolase
MSDKDWEKEEIKEFIKLMENYEKTWNPASEKLKEKKELKIDTFITAEKRDDLIFLLHEYMDVFAWTYIDMSGLDTDIVVHKIFLVEGSNLVKQKTRWLSNMLLKTKEKNTKIVGCMFFGCGPLSLIGG